MDNQPQTANSTPPTWAAFKKMGDVSAPSANPQSDLSYTPPAGAPAPASPPPVAAAAPEPSASVSVPSSLPADEDKKGGLGLGSIKSLLGLSKDEQNNTIPIQSSAPTTVSSTPAMSAHDQVPMPPSSTDLNQNVPTSMSIPSFVPENTTTEVPTTVTSEKLAVKEAIPVEKKEEISSSAPAGPVSIESPGKAEPLKSPEEGNTATISISPQGSVEPKASAESKEKEVAGSSTPEAPSVESVPFSPLSNSPSLLDAPPSQPPPTLPFPQANLPVSPPVSIDSSQPVVSSPAPSANVFPAEPAAIPASSAVTGNVTESLTASVAPAAASVSTTPAIPPSQPPTFSVAEIAAAAKLPSLDQQKEALKAKLANVTTAPPMLPSSSIQPETVAPISVAGSPAPSTTPITTVSPEPAAVAFPASTPASAPVSASPVVAPPAITATPQSVSANPVSPLPVPAVSPPTPSPAFSQPASAASPALPPLTQATPEPPPLATQQAPTSSAAPILSQPTPEPAAPVLQAPEFAPEILEPTPPPLENFPPSPQPAPTQPSADNGGFLGAPPTSSAPAVNFPGSQSPPSVSGVPPVSTGLRTIGDVSPGTFNLLANPPGSPENPPYLAPVVQPGQQQPQPAQQQQAKAVLPKKAPIWPIVGGVAVALIIVGIVAYLLISRSGGTGTNPSTLGAQSNQAVLAEAQGPDSWENDYSNSLLPIERGGLELAITDPLSEAVTPDSSLPKAVANSNVKSLSITVARAEVHLDTQTVVATSGNISATQSAQKAVDRWETLRLNDNNAIDLMDLRRKGGAVSSLGVTYLAAGHYTEVRLYITSVELTTISGEQYALSVSPSNGVIKIAKPFDVTATGTIKLTADFDAPASVAGSNGNYSFSPVLARFLLNGVPF